MRKWFVVAVLAMACAGSASAAQTLASRLSGKILLQVQAHGEAWYVNPATLQRYFLGRPDDAFALMRKLGLGISNANLALIPESTSNATGSSTLRNQLKGKILLQVEAHGEAWYVYPDDLKRYYLGRPADAFALMRQLGLGIADIDLVSIPVSPDSASPSGTPSLPGGQVGLLDDKDAVRVLIATQINAERQTKGLRALGLNHDLSTAAQLQANDMSAKGYTSPTSPSGTTISDWVKQASYDSKSLSENVAQTNSSPSGLVAIWKDQSPNSYQNLVSSEYEHVGVGIARVNSLDVYVVVFAKSFATFFAEQTVSLKDLAAVRSAMLVRVNKERADAGLSALKMQSQLEAAAQAHAQDMFDRAYYGHENPEGESAFERIKAQGYQPQLAAENIAKNQFNVTEVMDSWMNSPGHRANILDANLKEVGFGMAYGKNTNGFEILWVQNFAVPMM